MWSKLGLDLPAHDNLLAVVTDAYKNIYLSQNNRPKGMEYFDFVVSEIHGLRISELFDAKEAGRKIIGGFCIFIPEELILAVDAVSIGLCAGADIGSKEAEKYLPRNSCALIKAFMGFKLSGLCPYIESTDLLVGETTCDGKKKAYEIFGEITGKLYVMELPNKKGEDGRRLWKNEVKKFAKKLTQVTGKEISLEKLKEAASIVNEKRKALKRLAILRASDPPSISGLDALLINQISFYDDPVRFTTKLNELCDELGKRVAEGVGVAAKGAPRILISGSPMAIPNWKLHAVIESSGAVVVGEEACVGDRNYRTLLDEDFSSVEEAVEAIADRYMTIDCACFTPNDERLENIEMMTTMLNAGGVIHYALQFCTPYMTEALKVRNVIEDMGIPFLQIETDYSMGDMGQLKTRVEALLEIMEKK
jgi:benzoyl-CoA reductase/2-hydroxyglutaryl-CoA dehydratase subunit BcrC/BadD/HgdB